MDCLILFVRFLFSCRILMTVAFLLNASRDIQAETVAVDPLEQASAYSIALQSAVDWRKDYFPMGYIHGDPLLTLEQGYSQRQDVAMIPQFVNGEAYTFSPLMADSRGMRYYSMALAADSLADILTQSGQKGVWPIPTKGYGLIPAAIGPDGKPKTKGKNQCDVFDEATVRYLQDYVKAHVQNRVASEIGSRIACWGMDNEWEGEPNYSPEARKAFALWLREQYNGDVAALNEAWQTHYQDFNFEIKGRLPQPNQYKGNSGQFLDWWAFQTERFTTVIADMARVMYETDPLHRGVVHKATQLSIEMPVMNRERTFDPGRFADLIRPYSGGLYGVDVYGHGDRQAYELNYIYQCIQPVNRQPGYGVMLCEFNNHNGPGHQFASTLWRMMPNGAKSMMMFTTGFTGGKDDWDKFAFLDPATGKPKDKIFYAARWANMIHRTEAFWKESMPAAGMPRVAMLLPRRDVLLSNPSDRNPRDGKFSYPENHRWMVYRWLREQGYWVDVLPYTKLTTDYLGVYQALILVGAEHLSAGEVTVIQNYVTKGGVLVADARAGFFDEHHRIRHQLDSVLGVTLSEPLTTSSFSFELAGQKISGKGAVSFSSTTAETRSVTPHGKPLVLIGASGKGRTLYFPFSLGTLINDRRGQSLQSIQTESPTAESEEYESYTGEFEIGNWLAGLLSKVNITPAYRVLSGEDVARKIRIEQPGTDRIGNVAMIVTNRSQRQPQEILPPSRIEIPVPGNSWKQAWWSPAEKDTVQSIPVRMVREGIYQIDLPEIASAGVLSFFAKHPPLISIDPIKGSGFAIDGLTATVTPGQSFKVSGQLINTTGKELGVGSIGCQAVAGWKATTRTISTPILTAGQSFRFEYEIMVPSNAAVLKPDWLYPVVLQWSRSDGIEALATTHVEMDFNKFRPMHLLSDNTQYPTTYPYLTHTGATYRYSAPVDIAQIADPLKGGNGNVGNALTNGFSSIGGMRHSYHRGQYGTGHFARYGAPLAEIVFDLKSEHEIGRVNTVFGPGKVFPKLIRVDVSIDGENFTSIAQSVFEKPLLEWEMPIMQARGRYVRVHVEWPKAGGTLDEIEIWGR